MKITVDKVQSLNPCEDRFLNFTTYYPSFEGSVVEFLSLDNITHSDKVWVCVRLMTRNQKFYWAKACARSVLSIFEDKRPNDSRVRELLDYLDTIENVEKITSYQLTKIRRLRAAYAAYDAAARIKWRIAQSDKLIELLKECK